MSGFMGFMGNGNIRKIRLPHPREGIKSFHMLGSRHDTRAIGWKFDTLQPLDSAS